METQITQPAELPAQAVYAEKALAATSVMRKVTRARPGQPTLFSQELWETILDRIACGDSLLSICQAADMPGYSTVQGWARKNPDLRAELNVAAEHGAYAIDDANEDILRGGVLSTGNFHRDKELVAHNRWRQAKMNRRFAEKVQVDHVQHLPVILPIEALATDNSDGV